MSNTVFIYARRSSLKNKQDSISIDTQIKELKKECKERWLQIEWIYSDNESSFRAWKRDDFDKMLMELKKRNIKWKWKKIDYLYVYMVSRLARNRKEANLIIDLIEKENLQILSMNETYQEWYTWEKRLTDDLTNAIYESKEKSQKGKINMNETQRTKWKITRTPPFWYKMELDEFWSKKMVINNNNNEAEIVKKVFQLYSTWSYTYKSLAEYLNSSWYYKIKLNKTKKTKTKLDFKISDIENILIKPIYYWKIITEYKNLTNTEIKYFQEEYWDDIEIKDRSVIIDYTNFISEIWDFKTIITRDLYKKCLDIRQWRKGKTKKIENHQKWPIYLFRKLLICPCKADETDNMKDYFRFTQEEKINKKYGTKTNYYKCSGRNKNCVNKSISEQKLEKQIIEEFINWIVFEKEEIEIFKKIILIQLKKFWETKENISKLLEQKIKTLEKDMNKYYDLYIDEDDEDFRLNHKKKYKETKNKIEALKNQLKNMPAIAEDKEDYIKDYIYYINNLGTNFEKFPKARRRKIIESFFEYIVLNKISATKFEIVDFKLNPVFELAYNKKKLLEGVKPKNTEKNKKVRFSMENLENFQNTTSNLENGLSKSKISNSDNFVLNGSPTRNRT